MKQEPSIDKAALRRTVIDEFGIDLAQLEFIPAGELNYCYVAYSPKGQHYLLKVYTDVQLNEHTRHRILFHLALSRKLYTSGLFRHLPYPIETLTGHRLASFQGNELMLSTFIDAKPLSKMKEWRPDILRGVAHTLAKVHAAGEKLDLEIPFKEYFDIFYEKDLLRGLEELGRVTDEDTPQRRAARELLAGREDEIRGYLERLHALQAEVREVKRDFVLCHTDPTSSNMMVDDRGDLYLIDWEGAKLGPRELDLFLFSGAAFPVILDHYLEACGSVELDARFFGFYFYHRNLQGLAHWLHRLLFDALSPEQAESDLKGIAEACMPDWPVFEQKIAQVERALRTARVPGPAGQTASVHPSHTWTSPTPMQQHDEPAGLQDATSERGSEATFQPPGSDQDPAGTINPVASGRKTARHGKRYPLAPKAGRG